MIENLHEYETLEDEGEMQSFLGWDVLQEIVAPRVPGLSSIFHSLSHGSSAINGLLFSGVLPGIDLTSPFVKSRLVESDVFVDGGCGESSRVFGKYPFETIVEVRSVVKRLGEVGVCVLVAVLSLSTNSTLLELVVGLTE